MIFRQLFDSDSSTYTYLVADPLTRQAALIDPVRDQVERDLTLLSDLDLTLTLVLDTHVHADHVTAAGVLRQRTGARTVGGRKAAACVDQHVQHGDLVHVGTLAVKILETPGHTDDSVSYLMNDRVFSGDTLLVRGTGRSDFQNGDARALYRSLTQVLFTLPDNTLVYPGHDYKGHTVTTIGEERRFNPRVAHKSEAEFVTIMNELRLPPPKHLNEAVPANRACGLVDPIAPIQSACSYGNTSVNEAFENRHDLRLVDVREPDEWHGELGHIEGAELVPLATLPIAAQNWERSKPLMVVCRSGVRSSRAADWLTGAGFTDVRNVVGGMIAYNAAGLLVERN